MSLSFTKQPEKIVLAGDYVPVKILNDDAFTSDYTKITGLFIYPEAYPSAGDIFKLTFEDILITLTFANTVTNPLAQLPVKDPADTHEDYTQLIAEKLSEHPDIFNRASVHFQPENTELPESWKHTRDNAFILLRPRSLNNKILEF